MLLLKTFVVSLLVGTVFAASTLASRAPDHLEVVKFDLPIITTAMLPIRMDSNPYPASIEADFPLVFDEENCDETGVLDAVVQIEDHKSGDFTQSQQQ